MGGDEVRRWTSPWHGTMVPGSLWKFPKVQNATKQTKKSQQITNEIE